MIKRLDPHRNDQYQGKSCDLCGYVINNPDDYLVVWSLWKYDDSGEFLRPNDLIVCCHCDVIWSMPAPRINLRARIKSIRGDVPGALDVYWSFIRSLPLK